MESDVDTIFAEVQAKRYQRAVDAVNLGRRTNSASVEETFLSKIFVDYFFPRFGQSLILRLIVENTLSGPCVTDLPVPQRYQKAVEREKERALGRASMSWRFVLIGGGVLAALACSKLGTTGLRYVDLGSLMGA